MPHELDWSGGGTPATAGEADRRTVRRVAAFGAAAVAATALATAGVAQGVGTGSGPATAFGTAGAGLRAAPSASASAKASTSPSASASTAPQLKIQIAYDRVGRELTLTFGFDGYVVEPLTTDGATMSFPTPAKRDIGLGERLAWGDGTSVDTPIAGRRCPGGAETRTVHAVKDSYQAKKLYLAPGTYTIEYTYFACGLTNGKISGSFPIVIPK